jgi:DNA repair protein Crb2 Tudor domain/BRCT domain, a BRCA1 C-terminus domain
MAQSTLQEPSQPQASPNLKGQDGEDERPVSGSIDHHGQGNNGASLLSIVRPTVSQDLTHDTFPETQLSWTHNNGRVAPPSFSQSELPNTVPNSQPKKMSLPGSLPAGDTQPVSPSVHETIITKSRTALDDQDVSQQDRGTLAETQKTQHEGDAGHIDLLSVLEDQDGANSESSEPEAQWDPANMSPTQIELESPEDRRFQRPKTPATHGRKRNYRGETVDSSTPINPLAGNGTPALGAMGLSQVFNATQALSSPLPENLTSDPLSTRPSPNFQTYGQPPTAPLSSPMKLLSSARRPFNEPQTTYKSMKESQAERERRLKKRKLAETLQRDGDSSDSSDSVFGPEDSIILRQKMKRRMQGADHKQISSPIRTGPSSRVRKRIVQSSSPALPSNNDIGTSTNAIIVPDEDPDEGLEEHNSSEEETDVEDDLDDIGQNRALKPSSGEEDKENMDSSLLQVPMTTSRIQMMIGETLQSDLSPSLRRDKLRNGAVRRDGESDILHSPQQVTGFLSSPSIVPNSQPSQPVYSSRERPANASDRPPNPEESLGPHHVTVIPDSSPSRSQIVRPGPVHVPVEEENQEDSEKAKRIQVGALTGRWSVNDESVHLEDNGHEQSTTDIHSKDDVRRETALSELDDTNFPERQPGFGSARLPVTQQSVDSEPPSDRAEDHLVQLTKASGVEVEAGGIPANRSPKDRSTSMPPPSVPLLRQDVSSSSSHYDTAHTGVTGESDPEPPHAENQNPIPSILASPSGERRRALTEIAEDPTPSNSFGDEEFDIGDLMNLDEEFRTVVGKSTPNSPLGKRRRGNDGRRIIPDLLAVEENQPVESSPLTPPPLLSQRASGDDDDTGSRARKGQIPEQEDPITRVHRPSRQSGGMWDVSSHSPQRTTKTAKKLPTAEKLTSKMRTEFQLRTAAALPKQSKVVSESLPVLNASSPDPLQNNAAPSEADSATGDSQEPSKEDRIAPNMVFALFNGRTRAYYPAVCLGPAAPDQSRFRIKFEDTDLTEIDAKGVKNLELCVGNAVKVNLDGVPKVPHVVRGFKGKPMSTPSLADKSHHTRVTDTFGHTTLILAVKQRKSLQGAPLTASETTIEVPLSSIYLDTNMWAQLKSHKYTYTPPGETAASATEPPSAPASTPSTPSSRRGRFASTIDNTNAPTTGLFATMVFGVSYSQNEDKKTQLTRLILSNGGTILPEGFSSLFDHPSLPPISPSKRASKTACTDNDTSTTTSLTLTPSAQSLSFAALITDRHSRREKYLQALSLNIPCLSGRWIEDCVANSSTLPWSPYLLPAGESKYLDGAIRSRTLQPYPPSSAFFADTIINRPKLLGDISVLITMGRGRAEEKRRPYVFLTYALGAKRVCLVPDLKAASAKMKGNGEEWDWLYVDDSEEDAARDMLEEGTPAPTAGNSRKRKRRSGGGEERDKSEGVTKRVRVVVNETVVQSLIWGAVYEE